jgi:hypothetical protein
MASILRIEVKFEDGYSLFLRNVLSTYQTVRYHNPEDYNMNLRIK